MSIRFKPGIDALLGRHRSWLLGRKFGLISNMAALDSRGVTTASRLRACCRSGLKCLFGPEHGFAGSAGAGERQADGIHPEWGIPVYSLYGSARRPADAMLRGLDTLVYDVQDLGTRCYTYVSTLRHALESAAEHSIEVIVADRPIPLPRVVDGPVVRAGFRSFVSFVDTPLCYGLTPGETALWLKRTLGLDVPVRVARMTGCSGPGIASGADLRWAPPSPSIRSWETGMSYPATVFCEALPSLDYGAGTALAFRVFGARWMNNAELCEALSDCRLPGVEFRPREYEAASARLKGSVGGVEPVVRDPRRFKPALTAVTIVHCLQNLYGADRVWARGRERFFDLLFGTDAVRNALMDGEQPREIALCWTRDIARFRRSAKRDLLY